MVAGIGFSLAGAGLAVPAPAFRFAQALVGLMIARILALPVLPRSSRTGRSSSLGVVSVTRGERAPSAGAGAARASCPGTTAVWGSSPGAASAMTLMSASFGADMRLVAFMQYTRVVIVATLAALLARIWGDADPAPRPPSAGSPRPTGAGSRRRWRSRSAARAGRPARRAAGRAAAPAAGLRRRCCRTPALLRIELPPLLLAVAYAAVGWGVGLRFDRPTVGHAARALPAVLASITCLVATLRRLRRPARRLRRASTP